MRILGIETSCDETGIAIYDKNKGILINKIHSQKEIHKKYGGIVPELASRSHIKNVITLIKNVLKLVKIKINDINGIAYTMGPGLVGSLMVGATIGKSIAYSCKVPAIPVNHMEGHLLSPMLEKDPPKFPFLGLLISGKHTQLISAEDFGKYKILGESLDDAVGESFDKIANFLGLKYPGGSELSKLASFGIKECYKFPKPMLNKSGLEFSFSGLKTSVLKTIKNSKKDFQTRANIARSFEDTIINILIKRCHEAIKLTGFKRLVISGGVSSNKILRKEMRNFAIQKRIKVFFARPELCTDNGAMIAYVGMLRFSKLKNENLSIFVKPNWSIEKLKTKD